MDKDTLIKIFLNLDDHLDLYAATLVCKIWNTASTAPVVWMNMYLQYFTGNGIIFLANYPNSSRECDWKRLFQTVFAFLYYLEIYSPNPPLFETFKASFKRFGDRGYENASVEQIGPKRQVAEGVEPWEEL